MISGQQGKFWRGRFGMRQWVGAVLGPLSFVVLGLGLSAAGLPQPGAWAAGGVVWMSWWWICEPVPLWLTACLPLVLFPASKACSFGQALGAYFDPVNFLFCGGMLIAACLEQWSLHRRLALATVVWLGTSPRRIVAGFMLATGFITLWISNTATALLMYPIGMAVIRKFEELHGKHDPVVRRFGLALMLGIAYAASIGGIGTKIGTGPNLVFVKAAQEAGMKEIDFLTWMKVGLPIVVFCLPVVWLYLVRRVARLEAEPFPGGLEAIHSEQARLGTMKRGEWVALAAFTTAAMLWIFRQDIDLGPWTIQGWSDAVPWLWQEALPRITQGLPGPLAKMGLPSSGDSLVAMGIGLLLLVLPIQVRPIRLALHYRTASRISWGMLVLLGGGFAMAEGIQRSGLSDVIAGLLQGWGQLPPYLVFVVVCLITTALSEVASNVATASILLPLLQASAPGFGIDPGPLMLAATMAASFGFMLPAGTPPNAIVFASGCIRVPEMARSGLVVDLGGALVIATACYWLAPWALQGK